MARLLIAAPESEELQPLLERWRLRGHPAHILDVGHMRCFELPTLDVVAAVAGHGKTQFALQCQYLIDRLPSLEALVCVGAAGSLSESLRLGDVVVGVATLEHDYKLRFVPGPLPRHPATLSLARLRALTSAREFEYGVAFGPIASGDEDIVDAARAAEVHALTGALCVAWEGSGAARAAAFNGLAFLELRCITDGADCDAASSFRESCARVLPNLAELVLAWRLPALSER